MSSADRPGRCAAVVGVWRPRKSKSGKDAEVTPCLQSDVFVCPGLADLARHLSASSTEIPPLTPANGTLMARDLGRCPCGPGEAACLVELATERGKANGLALEDAGGDGDADGDEDQAAEEFAPLAGLGADPVAQLQPDQGQGDADGADDDRGDGEVDMEGAQGEANREVVDAQRCPGDQQPPGLLSCLCRRVLVLAVCAAECLHYGVKAGG